MPGPPADVEPSELFLKLQETPRPTEVVNFPRKTPDGRPIGKTRIQVLRSEDHDAARLVVKKKLCERYKIREAELDNSVGASVLGDGVARELLATACLTEKPMAGTEGPNPRYSRVFPDAESIGSVLSADEVAVLFNCYLLVQTKWGPYEKTIQTEEELSNWIKRLVEGAAEFPLRHLSSVHWAELASLLAARAYLLSGILESLFSSLPSTLQSRLATYSMGTGFFGKRAVTTPPDGSETSPESDELLRLADLPITIEDARDMALRLKDSVEGALAELDAHEATR